VRGIGFRSLTEALDPTTAQDGQFFTCLGRGRNSSAASSGSEPNAGLAAARRLGRQGGRPPKRTGDDLEAARASLANPDIGVAQIAHRLGVSPATLYRHIPAARTANLTEV
jgi:DNA invertase Pin-like site-specific DNA recombinase